MPDASSAASAAAGASPIQAAIGVVQAGIGIAQSISGNARLKKLRGMRTAYQTPQEYFDMNAMALNAAQTGYGAQTLNYLTTQNDRSLTSSFGAATSLGADANTIADIYDRSSQNIMKIGADNELQQFAKFNKVYETTQTLANQKVAEWADKEAKLKDDMAAAAQKVAAGNANLQSGLNMAVGSIANKEKGDLYGTAKPATAQQSAMGITPNYGAVSSPYQVNTLPINTVQNQLPSLSNPYGGMRPSSQDLPSWW